MENDDYFKKIINFYEERFFRDLNIKILFSLIKDYYTKYQKRPSYNVIQLEINKVKLKEEDITKLKELFTDIEKSDLEQNKNIEYFIDETEQYAKDMAIELTLIDSIQIMK